MILSIILVLLIAGTLAFHFLSPWYFTPLASNWGAMDDTVSLTFIVTGFVFVCVNAFVVLCIIRYRARAGSRAAYEPENRKLEWWLVGLTTVGVSAMLAPGLFVWAKFVDPPQDAAVVEVFARQWNWMFRFPGEDGKLGTVDASHVGADNPFGMNPADPNGQDDVLIANPIVHLRLDQPVKFLLRSIDVLHNFTVPQFRAKMDMVPGMVSHVWLTPTRTGTFDLLCEELCGIGHFAMRGSVVVDQPQVFDEWLRNQPTFAQTRSNGGGDAVAGASLYAVCAACHGVQAEGNAAMHAPRLAGQGAWYLQRQLHHFKQGIRGAHEKDVHGKTMAPMALTLVDDNAVRNVSAYIAALPDVPAQVTVKASAHKARDLFVSTCGACHGPDGKGRESANAPDLAGMSDWYLVTQLQNFKQGIRGAHPQDMYGRQMALMAATLTDDRAIENMVAHINELR